MDYHSQQGPNRLEKPEAALLETISQFDKENQELVLFKHRPISQPFCKEPRLVLDIYFKAKERQEKEEDLLQKSKPGEKRLY